MEIVILAGILTTAIIMTAKKTEQNPVLVPARIPERRDARR